jgi:hypothetical protein
MYIRYLFETVRIRIHIKQSYPYQTVLSVSNSHIRIEQLYPHQSVVSVSNSRIRIRIKVKSRIRINVKNRIRFRIKRVWILNTGSCPIVL